VNDQKQKMVRVNHPHAVRGPSGTVYYLGKPGPDNMGKFTGIQVISAGRVMIIELEAEDGAIHLPLESSEIRFKKIEVPEEEVRRHMEEVRAAERPANILVPH